MFSEMLAWFKSDVSGLTEEMRTGESLSRCRGFVSFCSLISMFFVTLRLCISMFLSEPLLFALSISF